jgi:molybdate transport system substrate-binding protein
VSGRREKRDRKAKKLILPAFAAILCLVVLAFIAVSHETEEETATITVSAAASLTEAFTDIAREFEAENPDTKVELNFAGSGTLRKQIESGAPVDVFASASESDMDLLSGKGLIEESSRRDFAANTVVMVVPEKNRSESPKKLEDLTAHSVEKIAIGNPETTPAGKYAKHALEDAGIWDEIESKVIPGETVKQVLTYVETGEVDAGFVFITDAENCRKDLYEIALTVPVNESIIYPIAVINESSSKEKAQKFVNFVIGKRGQEILAEHGFKKP